MRAGSRRSLARTASHQLARLVRREAEAVVEQRRTDGDDDGEVVRRRRAPRMPESVGGYPVRCSGGSPAISAALRRQVAERLDELGAVAR